MIKNKYLVKKLNTLGLNETIEDVFVTSNEKRTIAFSLNSENPLKSSLSASKSLDSKPANFDLKDIPKAHTLMHMKPDDMTSDDFFDAIKELGNIYESVRN
ncbi:hypothetical protein B9J93_19795 [Vibrio sp. V17_P4S1T151]|uniref:hypothetical protein n=1 Tax=unclassified Vibrio TaxID=2614977 RepID=UPI000B8EC912|nr:MULTISPECIES: hypothetical protein [unclassified Vibrio]OXX41498.1 hypothetical protein B9J93_19795 [Vibrio sp. V17_P4S1T151]OXX64437.1 hypothetical protein B9J89_00585 [Vibrio sp. V15_P4S5T153]